MYTMEEMKQAYDAYCAEMDWEGFTPMTFTEFMEEQEDEDYWRVDAYLYQ